MSPVIAGIAATLLAGTVQGLAGFGFALVGVPLLVLVLPPTTVMPVLLIHAIFMNGCIAWEARMHLRFRRIAPLLVAGVIGLPFGGLTLHFVSAALLKSIIGCLVILFATAQLSGFRRPVANEKAALWPVGFISGLLNGSTTMGGPPIILFLSNQGVEKHVFRANLVFYFMVLNIGTLPVFYLSGLISTSTLALSLRTAPGTIIGALLGILLSKYAPERLFRTAVLLIVLGAGILALLAGAGVI
ncbi:sulfite exporter TauE/SafE family protein [bacterium]|nr:sulfite exporter TauE/SafE family protein [candidate division CSSED10-310 bacterium]